MSWDKNLFLWNFEKAFDFLELFPHSMKFYKCWRPSGRDINDMKKILTKKHWQLFLLLFGYSCVLIIIHNTTEAQTTKRFGPNLILFDSDYTLSTVPKEICRTGWTRYGE